MRRIYLHKGEALHRENAYPLIRKAAAMYMADAGFNACGRSFAEESEEVNYTEVNYTIGVSEKGKPFFTDLPLEFSVTNSGEIWMCIISEKPCGIDVQTRKKTSYNRVAMRFFKPLEREYVKECGEDAFYRIWTRREAYGKMTGDGFFGDIPELVNDNLSLIDCFDDYYISNLEIGEGIYCAVCTTDLEPHSIILL